MVHYDAITRGASLVARQERVVVVWELAESDPVATRSLATELRLHPFVARVLVARGLHDPARARHFLSPRLADLTQPETMADREVAAQRIERAIRAHERITLFGDYDVDGTSSAALLASVLKALGADVTALVASRFDGGYGLSEIALEHILATKPGLVITCDCGTSDHDRLATLRSRGIDSIVVDHHKVPSEPLPAVAFLNPHRPDCGFPFKGLASVGLALSLAAAVRARVGSTLDLRAYLDLVAVGTIADVMPLEGDNRILTRVGLERLGLRQGRPGLQILVRESRLRERVRAHDVAFQIAPMLNAPGRLGSAGPTLALLLADDETSAARIAMDLVAANQRRRQISDDLIAMATKQVEEVYGNEIQSGIVVGADGWHPGVGGIVAGRLAERFGVPTIVVAFENGMGTGSARAPKHFTLFHAIARCASQLEQFGGHDAAAGMRVRWEKFDGLRADFAAACSAISAEKTKVKSDRVDAELSDQDLLGPLVAHLEALEPTGQGHAEPRVLVRNTKLHDVRPVGVGHLRARLRVGKNSVGVFLRDGIARRERGDFSASEAGSVDIIGALRADRFTGPDAVQVDLVAVRKTW